MSPNGKRLLPFGHQLPTIIFPRGGRPKRGLPSLGLLDVYPDHIRWGKDIVCRRRKTAAECLDNTRFSCYAIRLLLRGSEGRYPFCLIGGTATDSGMRIFPKSQEVTDKVRGPIVSLRLLIACRRDAGSGMVWSFLCTAKYTYGRGWW